MTWWSGMLCSAGFLLCACEKKAAPASPTLEEAEPADTARLVAPANALLVQLDAGLSVSIPEAHLDAGAVERYVRYQEALIPIYAALAKTFDRMENASTRDRARAFAELGPRAKAEEKARTEARLSVEQVERLEALVADIALCRKLANVLDEGQSLQKLETMTSHLPPEQRAPLEKALLEMKKRRESLGRLAETRKRFGEADVELVLPREKELLQGYATLTALLMGKSQ
jgi:hypothetical protein